MSRDPNWFRSNTPTIVPLATRSYTAAQADTVNKKEFQDLVNLVHTQMAQMSVITGDLNTVKQTITAIKEDIKGIQSTLEQLKKDVAAAQSAASTAQTTANTAQSTATAANTLAEQVSEKTNEWAAMADDLELVTTPTGTVVESFKVPTYFMQLDKKTGNYGCKSGLWGYSVKEVTTEDPQDPSKTITTLEPVSMNCKVAVYDPVAPDPDADNKLTNDWTFPTDYEIVTGGTVTRGGKKVHLFDMPIYTYVNYLDELDLANTVDKKEETTTPENP